LTALLEPGKHVSEEDIGAAIEGHRSLHDYLIVERVVP
jgi:hypothetical protein